MFSRKKTLSKCKKSFSGKELNDLAIITRRIREAGKISAIILFGSYSRGDQVMEFGENWEKRSDYDILVICANAVNPRRLEATLSNLFHDFLTPVRCVVNTVKQLNSNLRNGSFFYTDLAKDGIFLFDSQRVHFEMEAPFDPTTKREKAEEEFAHWFREAEEQFWVANSCLLTNLFRKAAFNLQQCVEFCYCTVEVTFSNYRAYEHLLSVLRKRALVFDERINKPFPMETKEQQNYFEYLDKAYIGSRYRTPKIYPVEQHHIDYWLVEVEKTLRVTQQVCSEHIQKLQIRETLWQQKKISKNE